MRIRFSHWWFRLPWGSWADGFVFYPWILFRHKPVHVPTTLFRHELEHYYQVQREGWFVFHIKYLWYLIRYGYWNNPYEVEARMAASQPLTEEERKIWDEAEAAHYSKNP